MRSNQRSNHRIGFQNINNLVLPRLACSSLLLASSDASFGQRPNTETLTPSAIQSTATGHTRSLRDLPRSLRDDRDIVLEAVSQMGLDLYYASPRLKADREVCLRAIRQCGSAFEYASKKLQSDRTFILQAVTENGSVLGSLSTSLQNDAEISLAAVKQSGRALQYASAAGKDQALIVEAALRNDGSAFEFASERLRSDPQLALLAAESYLSSIRHMSASLSADPQFAKKVLDIYGIGLRYFSQSVRNNPDVVFHAIRKSAMAIKEAGDGFLSNREAMLEAAKVRGSILEFVSQRWKNDEEFIWTAVTHDAYATRLLAKEYLENPEFLVRLIKENYSTYRYIEQAMTVVPDEVALAASQMQQALSVLKINHPERFDCTGEILRNRFKVADDKIKNKLKSILGEDYFQQSLKDTRPLCVALYSSYDNNGGLIELNGQRDNLDRLTKAYRLVYYEAETDTEWIDSLQEATIKQIEKATLVLVVGHGSPKNIRLGALEMDEFLIDLSDESLLSLVKECLKKGAIVVLASCSTCAEDIDNEDLKNIAIFFHLIFPEADIYAPMSDTTYFLALDARGLFVGPGYQKGKTCFFKAKL